MKTLVPFHHSERKLHMLAHGILNGVESTISNILLQLNAEPYQKDGKEFVDFTLVFES